MIELEQEPQKKGTPVVSIKVIGIGGAGGNTVNSIIESGNKNVECIVANTDAQALHLSQAEHKIQLGVKSTKGLGTGANPELGKRAAEEDLDKVLETVGDADIVFLAAGMGGGTGSGAISVIARALKERGILTIAVVTRPFLFEGKRRAKVAETVLKNLEKDVDTLIILPNQKLLEEVDQNVSMIDAFSMINGILGQSVKGISDIITRAGHINVDFSDVRTIMKGMGIAIMGTGVATGPERAQEAALQAISSPLFENMNITGAQGVLLNITGGKNLGLHEISQAASIIYEEADENANIILGSVIDETLDQEVFVTIIATGFEQKQIEETAIDQKVHATATFREEPEVYETKEIETPAEKKQEISEQFDVQLQELEQELKALDAQEAQEKKEDQPAVEKIDHLELIDVNDLDVPAFLRKELKEKTEVK
ncbi:cell division protein FtsZ [bacterium]|nr:cell division protein FtsZ [bacterium]